ncbi:MAG: AsmA-like C-terminal region-containing protein, partial [Bacteroidota bacterium]
DSLTVVFDGVEYLTNKRAEVDAVLSVSEDFSTFTFRENTARLNDFAFGFDGWFKMNGTSYDMDLTWQTKQNTFKSLLSLVPGIYTKDFGSIEAAGDVKLGGLVRGTFSDTQLPAFTLEMNVSNGMFHYPDLPESVRNIAVDLLVENKDGIIDNTRVDLKKMHLEFGNNPVDARMIIENLKNYAMDGNLKARLDLGALSKMFPMEGMTLAGMFSLDASAKGVYDSVRQIIPAVNAAMALSNGYARTKEFPFAAEAVEAAATVVNTSGKMTETAIDVSKLRMKLDGESFEATLSLRNLADYTWKAAAKGGIDLGKLTSIFPVEGMTLTGKLTADVQTSGKYSDLEAGRYDKLPTSGRATLNGFNMTSRDLAYPVGISIADLSLDPSTISLNKFESTVGKSDFSGSGKISNYLGFAMGNSDVLTGKVAFHSNRIDLNEFMTDDSAETAADTTSFSVIPVPANIDLQFILDAGQINFMDYQMTDATGTVALKDGLAKLNNVRFRLLEGGFTMAGTYDPRKMQRPLYDFDMGIDKLSIRAAAENFSLVKKFAPVAGVTKGNFSMKFRIAGAMDTHLSPDASSVNANGVVTIHDAGVSGSTAIGAITSLTKLKDTDQVTLKEVKISATITDGRLAVKPFDVKLGNFVTTISGSSGLNGSLDYSLRMMVPASMLGSQLTGLLTQAGVSSSAKEDVPLNIRLGGTFAAPKPELVATEQKQQVKAALQEKAEEKGKEVLKDALSGTGAKQLVGNLLGKDTTKKDSAAKAAPVQKLLEDKLKGLLKKKKKN